jgi:hypothetical protein
MHLQIDKDKDIRNIILKVQKFLDFSLKSNDQNC